MTIENRIINDLPSHINSSLTRRHNHTRLDHRFRMIRGVQLHQQLSGLIGRVTCHGQGGLFLAALKLHIVQCKIRRRVHTVRANVRRQQRKRQRRCITDGCEVDTGPCIKDVVRTLIIKPEISEWEIDSPNGYPACIETFDGKDKKVRIISRLTTKLLRKKITLLHRQCSISDVGDVQSAECTCACCISSDCWNY